MANNNRVEVAKEEDIPRLMQIIIPAFEHMKYMQLVGYTNTPENLAAAGARHLKAWKEHAKVSDVPFCIKCTHTDPTTGQATLFTAACWAIYDRPRPEEQCTKPIDLFRAEWIEDPKKRKEAQDWTRPAADRRTRWFGPVPHGELCLMCTDPEWERRGGATMCVQWGLDQCAKLGIPAWLEASEAGKPLYERLGFQVAEAADLSIGRGVPMIWWPKGTREEDKKPVMPYWGKQ